MSLRKVYTTLNVRKAESQTTIEGLHVGDVGSTQLVISLTDGTRAIDLTKFGTVTAMIHGKKPDGYEIHNQCDVEGGKILYTLTAQDTAVSGTVYYQLDVQIDDGSGEERCFSPCFRTQVSERVYEPVFRLLDSEPEDWAQNYANYYKKEDDLYVKNDDPTYAANTFYELVDPPIESASEFQAFWSAFHKVEGLFNQRLIIDRTTTDIGYDPDNVHKVFINATIQSGMKGVVFTAQDNKQYALCDDGLLRTRTYSGSYSNWAVTALRDEITSSNKNSTKLIPSIKAVVDYIASEISGKANADEVNAALAGKADVSDIPTVPTNVSAFTNDAGYITQHQDLSAYALAANVAASLALKADEENAVKYIEYLAGISSLADNQINDKKTIYRVWDSSFGWGLMFNVIASNVNAQVVLTHNGQILYREKAKNETWQNKSFTNVLSGYATASALESGLAGKAAADHTHSQYLTEHQDISGKADKATTLSGYGITDAYTKTETDSALSGKAALDHTHPQYLTEHQSLSNYYTKTEVDNTFASLDELNGELELYDGYLDNKENLSNKQTAITQQNKSGSHSDDYYPSVKAVADYVDSGLSDKADKSTTYTKTQTEVKITNDIKSKLRADNGVLVYTDDDIPYSLGDLKNTFYTKAQIDSSLSGKADTATTLAGYGITDAYTKAEADNKYLTSHQDISGKENTSNKQTSISSSSDPSTDSSYYPTVGAVRSFVNSAIEAEDEYNAEHYLTSHQDISGKADKATTLAGYGITNAYTKSEVDAAIAAAIGGVENGSY